MIVLNRIKKLYGKHFIGKLVGTITAICILGGLIYFIPILGVKAGTLPADDYKGLKKPIKEIPIDSGEILAAESDSKQLYIDTKTLNLKVKDKNTGKIWNSAVQGTDKSSELALLTVSYLGKDNNLTEWDSYQYCTALKSYTLNQIDNGVQIIMNINEGESKRFQEYYPQKMSVDRFENFFLKGIKSLEEEGKIEKTAAQKYELTLKLIYKKSVTEDCYAVAYSGTPPTSAVKLLMELAKLLGYTKEMLVKDSEEMGLGVTFTQPAAFQITLEAALNGEDFLVRVPTQEMVSENDYYTIQNIKVLPNFGAAPAKEYKDGYIFVPDGAGALFQFNTFNPAIPDYVRPVYDNDYYTDYYYMPEYGEELMMPVFGMIYGRDENAGHGFLGIIEQGAETSYINTKLADSGEKSTSSYNKVYPSFDVTQCDKVKVYGPYSDNQATYLADTGVLKVDYSLRYKLFPGKVTYFDMAKAYKEYLIKTWKISELNYPDSPKLYLDFIGTVSLKKRFLGIPYDSDYSMTTYQELTDIIKDLGDTGLVLEYSGGFNGGLKNKLNNRADLVPVNGSRREFNNLLKAAKEKNIELYLEASISKVYEKGNGFYKKAHTLYDFSNSPAEIYRYLPSLGIFNGIMDSDKYFYYQLSPRYLYNVTKKFLKASGKYDNLSVPDLAGRYYADYRFKKNVSPYAAGEIAEESLKALALEKKLSLQNPFMKYVKYGSYAEDISRESGNYAAFYTTIPFRQLVMNGLIGVTTENVNMSSHHYGYYVLQAVELGVYPKFTVTAKNVDVLKNSPYSCYYSTEYKKQKETMDKVYAECKAAWEQIGNMEITGHEQLEQNVFRTVYASGVSVITNYNLYSVSVDGKEIGALSYLLVQN